MEQDSAYIIRGGEEGKKRLNLLSEVLYPYTRILIEKDGPISGKKFMDVGCGGGNVSLMVAGMTGEKGHVTGIDFDEEIISLAEKDVKEQGVKNVSFLVKSAYELEYNNEFDIVYARFLLSHLTQPMDVLQRMIKSVKQGGKVIVEDVQFSGHFCYPESEAFDSYLHYYTTAAMNNGQNPEIGLYLFNLFQLAELENVQLDVIQPCFNEGAGKWMAYVTMEKIRDKVIQQGLATGAMIDNLLRELDAFTRDEQTIISLPRIFRVWGYKKNVK